MSGACDWGQLCGASERGPVVPPASMEVGGGLGGLALGGPDMIFDPRFLLLLQFAWHGRATARPIIVHGLPRRSNRDRESGGVWSRTCMLPPPYHVSPKAGSSYHRVPLVVLAYATDY